MTLICFKILSHFFFFFANSVETFTSNCMALACVDEDLLDTTVRTPLIALLRHAADTQSLQISGRTRQLLKDSSVFNERVLEILRLEPYFDDEAKQRYFFVCIFF